MRRISHDSGVSAFTNNSNPSNSSNSNPGQQHQQHQQQHGGGGGVTAGGIAIPASVGINTLKEGETSAAVPTAATATGTGTTTTIITLGNKSKKELKKEKRENRKNSKKEMKKNKQKQKEKEKENHKIFNKNNKKFKHSKAHIEALKIDTKNPIFIKNNNNTSGNHLQQPEIINSNTASARSPVPMLNKPPESDRKKSRKSPKIDHILTTDKSRLQLMDPPKVQVTPTVSDTAHSPQTMDVKSNVGTIRIHESEYGIFYF